MRWQDHITIDPDVCHGEACFRGTRLLGSVISDNRAAGVPEEEIRRSYPSLPSEGQPVALAYAADPAEERVIEDERIRIRS